jgi:hypothetical protein
VCLCKKGCLHNATIFHYGTSTDAVKVAKTRTYKCGGYLPEMITTATADLLEELDVKFSRSLINNKILKNSGLSKFTQSLENYIFYDTIKAQEPILNGYYYKDLLAEYSKNNPVDVIVTKETPTSDDSRVLSNIWAHTRTDWIHTDTAVSDFYKETTTDKYSATIDENNIVTIDAFGSNPPIFIKTTLQFAEAAGVVKNILQSNDSNRIIEVAQNQHDILANYTKQFLPAM